MNTKQAPPPPDISRLVAGVELVSIHCHEFTAAYTRDVDHNLARGLESQFISETACRIADDRSHFDIRVTGRLLGNQTEPVGGEPSGELLRVVTVFELRYLIKDASLAIEEEEVQFFGATNGLFHAWPYLREALQDALKRLGFGGFLLPMLRRGSPTGETKEPKSAGK